MPPSRERRSSDLPAVKKVIVCVDKNFWYFHFAKFRHTTFPLGLPDRRNGIMDNTARVTDSEDRLALSTRAVFVEPDDGWQIGRR
jgi:hypothetical protein